jgi:hypothetical protein
LTHRLGRKNEPGFPRRNSLQRLTATGFGVALLKLCCLFESLFSLFAKLDDSSFERGDLFS